MTRAKAWFVTTLLVVASVVVAVALCEAGLRLFYPQRMGVWHQDREGLPLHRPGLVTYLPQFGVTVSINSEGMRDREHPVEKPAGVVRILVLGDSFMEALQIPFERSFPSVLERQLAQASGRPVEVLNASVSGWGTDDALKYLTTHGAKWKPDMVVVAMTLHNDISDNLRERFHTIREGRLVEKQRQPTPFLAYKVIEWRALVASRLHVYQLLVRAKRTGEVRVEAGELQAHVVDLFREPMTPRLARGLEMTGRLIERIQGIATAAGGRAVVVLLPLSLQVSEGRFAAFARAATGSAEGLDRDRPQRLVRRLGDTGGIDIIDLLPAFREWTADGRGELYLERDGHWNEAGHRVAAGVMARELGKRGLSR